MSSYQHDHTHLTSQDLEKAVEFYTQIMDAKIIKAQESDGRKTIDIDLGGMPIRLSGNTGADAAWRGPRYGLHHLSLKVSNIEEFTADLKSRGVEFVIEITKPRPGVKIAFIKAPDNVLLEIVEVTEG
ncbi:MAG: VOC family protein [Dehalococcoidales bacterium]